MYTICYNGELYNTEDLRAELLKKGYTYQGHSDTEVLLTAYIEWGEACVDRLNGIFCVCGLGREQGTGICSTRPPWGKTIFLQSTRKRAFVRLGSKSDARSPGCESGSG